MARYSMEIYSHGNGEQLRGVAEGPHSRGARAAKVNSLGN